MPTGKNLLGYKATMPISKSVFKVISVMLSFLHKLKVGQFVVGWIPVFMVDNFVFCKIAANMFFHYETMLKNVAIVIGKRMVGGVFINVASVVGNFAALPAWSIFASMGFAIILIKGSTLIVPFNEFAFILFVIAISFIAMFLNLNICSKFFEGLATAAGTKDKIYVT